MPKKTVYTVPDGESQIGHNTKTKRALEYLKEHPEVADNLAGHYLTPLKNAIMDHLSQSATELSDTLVANAQEELCPSVARVWLANQLEHEIDQIIEVFAAFAYWDGDSKANLARACGLPQQAYARRFPHIEQLAEAQDRAEETQQTQTVEINGRLYDLQPSRPRD